MPRDGTERKPRDGTEGMPRDGTRWKPRDGTVRRSRDGTQGMPRDGTKRKPRDEIMLWKELPDAWNVMRLTRHTELIQNQGKRSSRWRKSSKCKPAFEAGNGEGTLFLEREREEYVTVNS